MITGFSTGSLALGDYRKAISMLHGKSVKAIELSSLREHEFTSLIKEIDRLDLSSFQHISFHAPSKLAYMTEKELIGELQMIARRKWSIIVHPDIITDFDLWNELGPYLCIENMDKRKSTGRTTEDLKRIFGLLPGASFCLDIAHARQVDPTMVEAFSMIEHFGDRLRQLHISDVNSRSSHEPINLESIMAFRKVASMIPANIPMILESPVAENSIEQEIKKLSYIFDDECFMSLLNMYSKSMHHHSYFSYTSTVIRVKTRIK